MLVVQKEKLLQQLSPYHPWPSIQHQVSLCRRWFSF
jgi:hypothetical protein